MLYMVFDKDNYVKVGYAKDVTQRQKQYNTCSPNGVMRWACAGDKTKEKQVHKELAAVGTRKGSTEWYKVDPETYQDLYEYGFTHTKTRKNVINRVVG